MQFHTLAVLTKPVVKNGIWNIMSGFNYQDRLEAWLVFPLETDPSAMPLHNLSPT
jgi:hypothetical protein